MESTLHTITDMLDEFYRMSNSGVKIPFLMRWKLIIKSKLFQLRLFYKRREAIHIANVKGIDDIVKNKMVENIKQFDKLIIDMSVVMTYCRLI